jgi:hypothetical protein
MGIFLKKYMKFQEKTMSTLAADALASLSLLRSIFPEEIEEVGNLLKEEKAEGQLLRIQLIITATLGAMSSFQERNLGVFCPPVGDEACQIRALQTFLLSKDSLDEQVALVRGVALTLLSRIEEVKAHFQELDRKASQERGSAHSSNGGDAGKEERKAIQGEINERYTLGKAECLASSRLDISVDLRILFLIRTYILTQGHSEELTLDKCFYKDVEKIAKFSKLVEEAPRKLNKASTIIIQIAKRSINEGSILFVQAQAKLLKCEGAELLQEICGTPEKIRKTSSKTVTEELPCTFLTRVIFNRARELNAPILLKIRSSEEKVVLGQSSYVCQMLFCINSEGNYVISPRASLEKASSALFIEAYSNKSSELLKAPEFQEELLREGGDIMNIIDLNTAQHRQYTNQSEKPNASFFQMIKGLPEGEKNLLGEKMYEAIAKGFSPENPSLCAIEHIFCDTLGQQADKECKS